MLAIAVAGYGISKRGRRLAHAQNSLQYITSTLKTQSVQAIASMCTHPFPSFPFLHFLSFPSFPSFPFLSLP